MWSVMNNLFIEGNLRQNKIRFFKTRVKECEKNFYMKRHLNMKQFSI